MEKKTRDPGLDSTSAQYAGGNTHKRGKNYLLCIGIDKYVHCKTLNNAVKDAEDFKNLLVERYQFEAENCTTIFNEKATRKTIEAILDALGDKITKNDNFIFYFSGHGEFHKKRDRGFWIPVEAVSGQFDEYIPNSTIIDLLDAIPSLHTFLIVDSCFSGTLFLGKTRLATEDRREKKASRWGLTAGRLEVVEDGEPGTNSPFAEKLLKVLRENNESLGVKRLCDEVEVLVGRHNGQEPISGDLRIDGNDYGQFFFHLREDESKTEKAAFEQAQKDGTEEALERFILDYGKKSTYYKEAITLLKIAEEDEAWNAAKRKGKLSAYLDFQEHYGNGKYKDQCNEHIEAIRLKSKDKKSIEVKDEPQNQDTKPQTKPSLLTYEPETIKVEGGSFQMGCTSEQGSDCSDSEKPVRTITLSSYSIGKYEVTVGQYLAFCAATGGNWPIWLEKGNEYNVETGSDTWYKDKGYQRNGAENLPIAGVSWNDAVAYCQWLSQQTGKNYRLPTEAEWEYAARGGNASKGYKYSGSNNIDAVAYYNSNSGSKPQKVGGKQANELGIYDMSGNVWEWCSDWYAATYDSNDLSNPRGPSKGGYRVYRGGSWDGSAQNCRVSYRGGSTPTNRDDDLGFRLAL